MRTLRAIARNEYSTCEAGINVVENKVIEVYWKYSDSAEKRRDIILNHPVELNIQMSVKSAGEKISLKVIHNKKRAIQGSNSEFEINGITDINGIIKVKGFLIECDFSIDNLDLGTIDFYYLNKYTTSLTENFGWTAVKIGTKTKVLVNVELEIEYLAKGFTEDDYKNAINRQFKRTLEMSSNNSITGKIYFRGKYSSKLPQIVPKLLINKKPDKVPGRLNIVGGTTYNFATAASESTDNNGFLLLDLGETVVHELLHTLRLDHPFSKTQTDDCRLIRIDNFNYKSTSKTNKNIYYNIMNYGIIYIDGKLLNDLWKTQRPEYLTPGQLEFMLNEIKLQSEGAGNDDNGFEFIEYWMRGEYPGEELNS